MPNVGLGLVAGAVGSTALNVATYLDMAIRWRAVSKVPTKLAGALMDSVGVSLGKGATSENRRSSLGALFGYGTGIGTGAVYSILRPRMESLPFPVTALVVGLGAMAASDVIATAYGATDPRKWGMSGWASDILFHMIYGYVTVAIYEALADD